MTYDAIGVAAMTQPAAPGSTHCAERGGHYLDAACGSLEGSRSRRRAGVTLTLTLS